MGRGRARTPIYEAWEQIVFPSDPKDRLSPSGETTWRLLWNTHIEEDFEGTSIDDAVLLCSLGWDFAVRKLDWEAATYRASRCALHPAWAEADSPSRHTLLGNIALGNLQMGQLDVAVLGFRELLALQRPRDRVPLLIVRNHLYLYCVQRPHEEIAPTDLVRLSGDVLALFKGCARVAKRLRAECCSFGDLAVALERSYPSESGWRGYAQSLGEQ